MTPATRLDLDPDQAPDRSPPSWLEQRLPVGSVLRRQYRDYPLPRNLNALWFFGAFAVVTLVAMIVTGICLALHYTPTAAGAFDSVEAIIRRVPSGWILRSVHMAGASCFFAVLYVHIFRGLYYGSYKAPREVLWLSGFAALLMVMAAAFFGYVLPWGQMSYWGAVVVGNAVAAIPLVGHPLAGMLLGGDSPGAATPMRFFVLHMLCGGLICAVLGIHIAALHVTGSNNPAGIEPRRPADTLPMHPFYTTKDGVGVCVFLIVLVGLAFLLPGWLTEADNYRPADPLLTPPDITPEWYFTPFYALLRSVPSRLGGLLLAGGALAVVAAVPWLDRAPTRSARLRPLARPAWFAMAASFVLLGIAGSHEATGMWLWLGRLAGLYWFAHFLVLLPLIARIERPRPLPASLV